MNEQLLAQYASRIVGLEKKLRQVEARQVRGQWDGVLSAYLGLPGLRAFWPMSSTDSSGNVYDLSGQGRTLTYNGGGLFNASNQAPYYDIDGNDYLSRADEAGLEVLGTETYIASAIRGLSIGGWFNINASGGGTARGLISKDDASSQRSYVISQAASADQLNFGISNTGSTMVFSPAVSITLNHWYFVVGTYDPSASVSLTVYGDNVSETQSTTSSVPASIFDSTTALEIGRFGLTNTRAIDGQISLCFLCAAMLSDEVCQSLYQVSRGLFRV